MKAARLRRAFSLRPAAAGQPPDYGGQDVAADLCGVLRLIARARHSVAAAAWHEVPGKRGSFNPSR
jgi:hypothetical protein